MVAQYGTFTQTFPVTTSAANLFLPYDAAPPTGITPGVGVSVDALFLAPGQSDWGLAIVQPCYYSQPYTLSLISSRQHGLPTGSPVWTVRFSPNQTGTWQWRTRVTDSSGTVTTDQTSFTVTAPTSHGPIRVSSTDSRYFAHADGTYRPVIGVNGSNDATIDPKYATNGVNLVRLWFSNQCLLGSGHAPGVGASPWSPLNLTDFDHFVTPLGAGAPATLGFHLLGAASTAALYTFNQQNSAAGQAFLSCKRSTTYQFSLQVITTGLTGSGAAVTVKLGGFYDATSVTAGLSGLTPIVTTPAGSPPTAWTTYTGTYTTGATEDFFGGSAHPYLYLALEGSTTGEAKFLLTCQEVLGVGLFGPNQLELATGALDRYSQLGSAVVDSVVASAESQGIAIKAVIEEKSEVSWTYLNADGSISSTPTSGNIYNDLNTTQTGWLQRAYARYLTARWGASSAIHSLEHVNENGGGSTEAAFTDQLASYFHSIDPNQHLVSTSVAASLRTASFWGTMTHVDYQDLHAYLDTGDLGTHDWVLPMVDNAGTHFWTWVSDTTYPGAIQMDTSLTQQWFLGFVTQEAGTWTISADVNTLATTGGTFGWSGPCSASLAVGQDWTHLSATFTVASASPTQQNLLIGAGTHTGGTGKIRNLAITSPTGKRLITALGDGTFPQQTDISQDAAAFHLAYDAYAGRAGQALYSKPIIRGEMDMGNALDNTTVSGLSSDTNLVWLHTLVMSQLGSGGLHEVRWPLNTLVDTHSGWNRYQPLYQILTSVPLDNGHYVDAAATCSNGLLQAIGQKDTTNGRAHIWVRPKNYTWANVVASVTPSALTGTVSVSGFTPSTVHVVKLWLFDNTTASTIYSSSVLSDGSGVVALNLAALPAGTVDAAFTIAPTGDYAMTSVHHPFMVYDTAATGSPPKTGLTPAFTTLKKLSDNTSLLGIAPTITELGGGLYDCVWDADTNGEAAGVVDCGSSLTNDTDRYVPLVLAADSGRIITNLDAQSSVILTDVSSTAIASAVQTGLTSQGYTSTRAGYLDVLNGIVAAIWAAGTRTLTALANVTIGGYATGQDPATLLLTNPANKLLTNSSGQVQHDMTQAVPSSPTQGTVGDALLAAEAQGVGRWTLSGTTLTLYRHDGTTVVRAFTLDSATAPTTRS